MSSVLALIDRIKGGVPQSRARDDDDSVDRLSHRYTTSILIMFNILVLAGDLTSWTIMQCWLPAHFTGSHSTYAHYYCYVKNTYYLPLEDRIPQQHESELRHTITYYQWVAVILLAQAFLFFFPCIIWRWYNSRCGIDVNDVIKTSIKYHTCLAKDAVKEQKLNSVVNLLFRYVETRHWYKQNMSASISSVVSKVIFCFNRRKGTYLTNLYIAVKILYLANSIGQLFLLDYVLNHSFSFYGIFFLKNIITGNDWTNTERFPRITMCDFKVRRMGSIIQRYTVQCTLPDNIFHEKIFLFLWFWIVMVAIATFYSLLKWFVKFMMNSDNHRFIRKHLVISGDLEINAPLAKRDHCVKFVTEFLKPDGVFILQLLEHNTDSVTANDVISEMWHRFSKDEDFNTYDNLPRNDVDNSSEAETKNKKICCF